MSEVTRRGLFKKLATAIGAIVAPKALPEPEPVRPIVYEVHCVIEWRGKMVSDATKWINYDLKDKT